MKQWACKAPIENRDFESDNINCESDVKILFGNTEVT